MFRLAGVEHGPRLVRVPFECREGGVGFADCGLAEEFDAVVCCGRDVSKASLFGAKEGEGERQEIKCIKHTSMRSHMLMLFRSEPGVVVFLVIPFTEHILRRKKPYC